MPKNALKRAHAFSEIGNVELAVLSQDKAIQLGKRCLEKELTYEGAFFIMGLYESNNDEVNFQYWNEVVDEAERKNLHMPVIVPDVLQKESG